MGSSGEDIKKLQYYHHLTSEFDQEYPKLDSLKKFIVVLADPNHLGYTEIQENDVIVRKKSLGIRAL